MERMDYNIEFAHVYSAESIAIVSTEQQEGVRRTRQIIQELSQQGTSFALSLLVDDYNRSRPFDPGAAAYALDKAGLSPQFIMPESALVQVADSLIHMLPAKFLYETDDGLFLSTRSRDPLLWVSSTESPERDFLEIFLDRQAKDSQAFSTSANKTSPFQTTSVLCLRYVERGQVQYSCPLLTACWHLMRLGIPPFNSASDALFRVSDGSFFAERLITVLPSKYLKVEAAAMEIISLSKSKRVRRCKDLLEYLFF